jgi:hypothetical protein
MTFLHNLSEKCFSVNKNWGICVSVTGDYLIHIQQEAAQLKDGRFDFVEIEPLSEREIKEYIEKKTVKSHKTLITKATLLIKMLLILCLVFLEEFQEL